MNDIIINGTEIKQRIISEINNARQCIYLAMAWFTDRDIANAIIGAKNRNVAVDIILSSNAQNETVKLMFKEVNISVHSFDTGDERGLMHHKFFLIDNRISINGSFNYSYNASNNNVENIQVSDDYATYKQLFAEFERLKYNIDNNIDVNITTQIKKNMPDLQPTNLIDSFSQQLSNLVYISAQFNIDEYKIRGYEASKENRGSVEIFKTEYLNIIQQISVYATDDSLSSKKNTLMNNVNIAFENKKAEIESDKQKELLASKNSNSLEKTHLTEKITELKSEKSILESGNSNTGENGLLKINREIDIIKLEKETLEQSFQLSKFWSTGTIFGLLGIILFTFYLSIFFSSAMYKVFFEGNVIRETLLAGGTPKIPQIVDANAVIKIFKQQGVLFGIMSSFFFLIPILLSNLKLLGSKKEWVNTLCFWVGLLIFDILVAIMVAINTDEIKCLLVGKDSQLQIWEVWKHGEFWLIFVFGMLPLIIAHFLIEYVTNAYKKSKKEIVDAEKANKLKFLELKLIELNSDKNMIIRKIDEKESVISEISNKIKNIEIEFNNLLNQIENKYSDLFKQIKSICDDFVTKITSGRIFTDEILNSIVTAYKSGYVEYLPKYYADDEVTKRVHEIETILANRL